MDPNLDGSHNIATGLRLARASPRGARLGLPTACELLDPITPQVHRRSDLLVGHRRAPRSRNASPDGLRPLDAARLQERNGRLDWQSDQRDQGGGQPQTFLGINLDGLASAVVTRGNPDCHVVLRGGSSGPNYSAADIARTEQLLVASGLIPSVLVDCSHDNSAKQPERQPEVMRGHPGADCGRQPLDHRGHDRKQPPTPALRRSPNKDSLRAASRSPTPHRLANHRDARSRSPRRARAAVSVGAGGAFYRVTRHTSYMNRRRARSSSAVAGRFAPAAVRTWTNPRKRDWLP